jgi:PGF-pre-PGF domain-containing protein
MKKSLVLAMFVLLVSCFAVSALNQGQRYYYSGTLAQAPVWNPQDGKVFETVDAGMPYTIDIKAENIAITKVIFTINRTVDNGGITIYHLLSKPKAVPDVPENDSYEFNELRYTGFVPFDTTNLIYQFKVAKSWLGNNTVSRDSVALHAYNRVTDVWDTLPTKIVGEDDSYVLYRAEGKGVHYLFIGKSQSGDKAESVAVEAMPSKPSEELKQELGEVEKVQPSQLQSPVQQPAVVQPMQQPPVQIQQPAETNGSSNALGALILVVIAVVAIVVYLVFGRQSTSSSVDKELHSYIEESIKRGKTREEVKHRLLEVGWHHERVEKALAKHKEGPKLTAKAKK